MTEAKCIYDYKRTATLWLLNGQFMGIPEEAWCDLWPDAGDDTDQNVAQRLNALTGLKVTVEAVRKTTTQ